MPVPHFFISWPPAEEYLSSNIQGREIDHSSLELLNKAPSFTIVSTDLVGSRYAGVVDSQATIVDGDRAVLYVWYDNEFGYSCQVIRVMHDMADILVPTLPAN